MLWFLFYPLLQTQLGASLMLIISNHHETASLYLGNFWTPRQLCNKCSCHRQQQLQDRSGLSPYTGSIPPQQCSFTCQEQWQLQSLAQMHEFLVFLPSTFPHTSELHISKMILVLMVKSFLRTPTFWVSQMETLYSYQQTSFLCVAKTHLCCFSTTDIVIFLPLNSGSWEIWRVSGFLSPAWTKPWQGRGFAKTHRGAFPWRDGLPPTLCISWILWSPCSEA